MISDISDGGVKIIAEYPEIPAEFTVIFSQGRPRACKLAWRIGFEVAPSLSIEPDRPGDQVGDGKFGGSARYAARTVTSYRKIPGT